MNEPNNSDSDKSSRIIVHGTAEPPSHETVRTYIGQIVDVLVGEEIVAEGTPFFDLCRFGKVISVDARSPETSICSNCEQDARSAINVLWESNYSTSNRSVCEHCILGIVTSGTELIDFPLDPEVGLKNAPDLDEKSDHE